MALSESHPRLVGASTFLGVASLVAVVAGMFLVNGRAPYNLCEYVVLGLMLSPLAAITAIVLGHIARHKRAFISGYASLALFIPVVLTIDIFWPCGDLSPGSIAQSAVGALRTINTSEGTYAATYNTGFSQTLLQLDGPSEPNSADAAGLIDSVLASGRKSGYVFTYSAGPPDTKGRINSYTITTRPLLRGSNSYFTDESGVIRWTREDRPATAKDPGL